MSAPTWDEDWLRQHVWPRFSRALAREEIYLANHSLDLFAWYRLVLALAVAVWLVTRGVGV